MTDTESTRSGQEAPVDIVVLARRNEAFRRVIITGEHSQVVVMTIPPGEEIGEEVHEDNDQVLVFIEGEGQAVLDGSTSPVAPNQLVFVRAGTRHNFVNTGSVPLRLVTIYAPPEHPPGTVHQTKEQADAAEHH
ncbi:MAG TPA: cupin domain-containing protein [Actinomycetes bacterium]|nr:cupin domain-containing protein [Actinomycetes bacterium]